MVDEGEKEETMDEGDKKRRYLCWKQMMPYRR